MDDLGQQAVNPPSRVLIDVDKFKTFNDAHGHYVRNPVLKVLAANMSDMQGNTIYPCRIGGEEFAILISGSDTDRAEEVIDGLRARLAEAQITPPARRFPMSRFRQGLRLLAPAKVSKP